MSKRKATKKKTKPTLSVDPIGQQSVELPFPVIVRIVDKDGSPVNAKRVTTVCFSVGREELAMAVIPKGKSAATVPSMMCLRPYPKGTLLRARAHRGDARKEKPALVLDESIVACGTELWVVDEEHERIVAEQSFKDRIRSEEGRCKGEIQSLILKIVQKYESFESDRIEDALLRDGVSSEWRNAAQHLYETRNGVLERDPALGVSLRGVVLDIRKEPGLEGITEGYVGARVDELLASNQIIEDEHGGPGWYRLGPNSASENLHTSSRVEATEMEISSIGETTSTEDKNTHSPEFRSSRWNGTTYSHTPTQAIVVSELDAARRNRTHTLSEVHLLEKVHGTDATERKRLRDLFRKADSWRTMIIKGERKGTFRLAPPTNSGTESPKETA